MSQRAWAVRRAAGSGPTADRANGAVRTWQRSRGYLTCIIVALATAAALLTVLLTRNEPQRFSWKCGCLATLCLAALAHLFFLVNFLHTKKTLFRSRSGYGQSRPCQQQQQLCSPDSPRVQAYFPMCPDVIVEERERQWFEEAVMQIYNLEFTPGSTPTSVTRPIENFWKRLENVKKRVNANILGAGDRLLHEPLDDIAASRALCAQDFNVEQAADYCTKYAAWRRERNGSASPPALWLQTSSVLFPFLDRHGRPVVVVRARHVCTTLDMEVVEEGYRATMDAVVAHFMLQRRTSTVSRLNPLEQYICFLDLRHAGWQNFSRDWIKMMARESATHYADRLANVYVLFPNPLFQALWRMASPLLHPRTLRKVQLIPHDKVPDFVSSMIGAPERVPVDYGGMASNWPSPAECTALQDMSGAFAASIWRTLGLVPADA